MNTKFLTLILFVLPLVSFISLQKTKDTCEQFRTGKFLFRLDPPGRDISFIIERNDSIQTETEKTSGKYTKLSIKWVEPCIYEAKMIETTFNFPDSVQRIRRTVPLRTKILSWTKDYYLFETSRGDYIMKDTMWILK